MSAPSPAAGILYKIAAAACMTAMMACVKGLDGRIPPGQVVFFRAIVTLLPVVLWLAWRHELRALCRPASLRRHLGRGLSGTASMVGIFVSLACLPLSDAVMLGYAAPLITVLLARTVLHERVPTHRWASALLGAMGVVVALSPHWQHEALAGAVNLRAIGVAAGLAGAFFGALSMIQIRRLVASEPAHHIVFHYTLTTAWIGTTSALLGWVRPDVTELMLMLGAGVFSGLAQWLIARSLHHASASITAPFEYTTLLWSVLIGALVFGEQPGLAVVVGAILILTSGALTVWREWGR